MLLFLRRIHTYCAKALTLKHLHGRANIPQIIVSYSRTCKNPTIPDINETFRHTIINYSFIPFIILSNNQKYQQYRSIF